MDKLKKMDNVALFMIFEIFKEPLFWGPIIISYIINVGGMSLEELYTMEAVLLGFMVIVEIYSSSWADLLGRKGVIVLGALFNLLAMVIFSIANCPWQIWAANILIMLGFSLISGSDEALIADYLKEKGEYEKYLETTPARTPEN
jgi:MFS family permease